MMNWIAYECGGVIPPKNRPLICYCPEWCDEGYKIAIWNGDEFLYQNQPNNGFNQCIEKWAIFLEAD